MKICIPVNGPQGLDAEINPEFTETEHLFIFDTESGEHRTFSRDSGQGADEEPISVDVVLCTYMPMQLLEAFSVQQIQIFTTQAETAGQALMALQNGEAEELVLENYACGCGGHQGDEEHECCGGGEHHAEGGCGGGCGCH